VLALVSGSSCALWLKDERDDARSAREELESCRREHATTAETACAAAEMHYETELRRYEDASRKAWGCSLGEPDCTHNAEVCELVRPTCAQTD